MKYSICDSCRVRMVESFRSHVVRNVHGQKRVRTYTRPSFAPKPVTNLKHIRENPGLYEQNSLDRNYPQQARNSWRILELHQNLLRRRDELRQLRRQNNELEQEIRRRAGSKDSTPSPAENGLRTLVDEARKMKEDLRIADEWERGIKEEMESLAMEIPNLSSNMTPVGSQAKLLGWVGGEAPSTRSSLSHVEIGRQLDVLDFEASATTSGWGWYFLKNEGALLEQALIQYALSVAIEFGWKVMTPPSLVYGHIASACGFMPRDQNGETQIYNVAQENSDRPGLVLAGTAEIPFAASQANKILQSADMPLKVIGPSRSYRAEAGARGVDTKGLYRVHEFTKVEMFAWTLPPVTTGDRFETDDGDDHSSQTTSVFAEMLQIQTRILSLLGLHAKILEMSTDDLGASASRKVDIEAFFPSRRGLNEGYGEVTSASICTDYQTRRLGTRLKDGSGGLLWPYTLNGTAIAIPRVLACLLENGWDDQAKTVRIPEVLRKWMPGNISTIGKSSSI